MAPETGLWAKQIAVEPINGVPFRMYTERPRQISDLIAIAEQWGSRPHIIQGDRVVRFDELGIAVAAKALVLIEAGVSRGDHVLILGWNSPDWIINFWACVRAEAIPVLGNAWWGEGELDHALNLIKPAVVLADRHSAAKIPSMWQRVYWETEFDTGGRTSKTLALNEHAANENDPAVVVFTSGTSGTAKAVVLSHRALLANLQMMLHITRQLPLRFDSTRSEICLHTGPLFHVGGPQAILRGITVGNTLVFLSGRYDPAEAMSLIEQHKINRWTAVPTMVSRLLEHPDVALRDMRSLKAIGMGGAPVHSELLRRIETGLPDVQVRVAIGYGLTENTGPATTASGADSADKPGTSGRPLPLVELKVVPQPDFPDGEILIRSPTQMSGYYSVAESPIDADGWLHTGDLGRVDDAGLLWITGRSKDLIIRGGENIAPIAVERALMALPNVSEAAVVGIPHPDLGEEVMAFVVVKDETSPDVLQSLLRKSLASFAVPSRWKIQKEPLPTNQTGKVDKAALLSQWRAT